jgi:hypothetical protein
MMPYDDYLYPRYDYDTYPYTVIDPIEENCEQ